MNAENDTKRIGYVLSSQFNNSWRMLRQAINSITDEYWSRTTNDWSFSWNIYHIIETAEFYIRDSPNGMNWGYHAGINWNSDSENITNEKKQNISKDRLLNYLKDIEDRVDQFLRNSSNDYLYGTDDFDEGTLPILDKIIYLLRHSMFHIGELSKFLRDSNCVRIKWT